MPYDHPDNEASFAQFVEEHWVKGIPENCTKYPLGGTNCLAEPDEDMCESCRLFADLCFLWDGGPQGL